MLLACYLHPAEMSRPRSMRAISAITEPDLSTKVTHEQARDPTCLQVLGRSRTAGVDSDAVMIDRGTL